MQTLEQDIVYRQAKDSRTRLCKVLITITENQDQVVRPDYPVMEMSGKYVKEGIHKKKKLERLVSINNLFFMC